MKQGFKNKRAQVMKLFMKNLLAAVCILMLFYGCETSTKFQIKQDIHGSWLLVKRSGGFAGMTEFIDTKKDRYVLNYYPNNTAVSFYNDTLTWAAYYTIEKKKSVYSTEDKYSVVYKNKHIQDVILYVSDDTLSLGDNVIDGFFKLYIRNH